MTVILGVDSSASATGCSVWHDGVIENYTWSSDPRYVMQRRWQQIMSPVWTKINRRQVKDILVVIEQPNKGAYGSSMLLNNGLYAVLTYSWFITGIQFVDIQPAQLKKFAVGKGAGKGTDKQDVLLAIDRRYGHLATIRNDNEADAFTMMAMALEHYGRPLDRRPVPGSLPWSAHIEKLDTVNWPEWSLP